MGFKIAVDGNAVCGLPQVYPIRHLLRWLRPFLQEQHIRCHIRTGVPGEGVVRQTYRAQKVGPLRQIFPHGGILLIQRSL